jgi:glycosyltransferase involved in cell wall biosynthesis
MRIALLAPPMLQVPPARYAGTERIVGVLAEGLQRRGHHVTLFAAGDSTATCELVATVPEALWPSGFRGDPAPFIALTADAAWRQAARFDLIHSHLDTGGFTLARHAPVPVLSTLHTRLDLSGPSEMIDEFHEVPLVSISQNQRRWHPRANWVATIHNGLPLADMPFSPVPGSYLALVGRIVREKGIEESIAVAQAVGLPLRIAAKVMDATESAFFDSVVRPVLGQGVEYLGEVGPERRDPLLAEARATLMLGAWPEPFGLVAIESLATGTPVIARRAGALPEIVEHGVDGFLVDDAREGQRAVALVGELDRTLIRRRALERFGAERMVDAYERLYRRLVVSPRPLAHVQAGPRDPLLPRRFATPASYAFPSRSEATRGLADHRLARRSIPDDPTP